MGHILWLLHLGVDEPPFATYFAVHQGYRVLTHSPYSCLISWDGTLLLVDFSNKSKRKATSFLVPPPKMTHTHIYVILTVRVDKT